MRVVAHPEIGPEVLGQQVNSGAIALRIGLCQVAHSLYQHTLPFDIPWVRLTIMFDGLNSGSDWNREKLSHESVDLNLVTNDKAEREFIPWPEYIPASTWKLYFSAHDDCTVKNHPAH